MAIEIVTNAAAVSVPLDVKHILRDTRIHLRDRIDPPIFISDRRLLKAVKMLCISACTNGRDYVNVADCLLLKHVLWYSV